MGALPQITNGTDNGARELRLFDLEHGPLIHVEVNMEELPIFLFKVRERVDESLEVHNRIRTAEGQHVDQYVKVTGGRELGLPGPADRDVYVALMRHVHRGGGMPADGRVDFTFYGLLRLMGINPKAGKNQKKVRDSLNRIADTVIYAENAFYNLEGEAFESRRFTPWGVTLRRVRHRGVSAERHTLKFDEVLVRSYNANYLKSLDSDFYFSLQNALAKTLYGLVDVRRKGSLRWTSEIHQLRQLIPLPETYQHPSRIKQRLEAAHKELLARGFLARVDFEEREGGTHLVHYGISSRFVRERAAALSDLSPRDHQVVTRLTAIGMWPEAAHGLVRDHGPDHCLTYLDALPYQRGVENPAAWVRRYAENGWPVPLPDAWGEKSQHDAAGGLPEVATIGSRGDGVAGRGSTPPVERETHSRASEEPPPGKASRERAQIDREVKRRIERGEFDEAIAAFESLPYDVYKKYVGTPMPVLDEAGNKFYLSLDGDLYVYVNGTAESDRFFVRSLDRSRA